MKILITGFGSYYKVAVNPTEKIIRHLRRGKDSFLIPVLLQAEYNKAEKKIKEAIRKFKPEAILMLGFNKKAKEIEIERIALNLDDSKKLDNTGKVRRGERILRDGALAYQSTLPINKILQALKKKKIPAEISNHAGTFICNHVFYVALYEIERLNLKIPCGFIHVPCLPGQIKKLQCESSLPLSKMIKAVNCCLEVIKKG